MLTRRRFLIHAVSAASACALPLWARADSILSESDPQAQAEGYHANASTIDPAAYPSYRPGRGCDKCALLLARHNDGTGRCVIFAEKSIELTGWCKLFTPKDYLTRRPG